MGLKDRFEKLVSYFDTDDLSEMEDSTEQVETARPKKQAAQQPKQTSQRPTVAREQSSSQRPAAPRQASSATQAPVAQQRKRQQSTVAPSQPQIASQSNRQVSNNGGQVAMSQFEVVLKCPRVYDDAQEIVNLLNNNICVMIDFQYMLDAQARRCLDFIDGASEVLNGTLQRVGGSIYLLAPSIVKVDMSETMHNMEQNQDFDFDMKRR